MITKVLAVNFLSWKNLEFNVTPGVTLIDGWNEDDQTSEGSGKSAILNAIAWCLYGKLPKDVKIDEVIRQGESSCSVAVQLSSVTILRSRKPNELMMIDGAGNVIKGKDAKETQDLIEAHVGLSFETFCQTVYFAQNYAKKFITSNQEEKGKILSEVQDLTLFDRARKEVTELLKKEELKSTQLKHSIDLNGRDALVIQGQIKVEEMKAEQTHAAHKQRLAFLENRVEEAKYHHALENDALIKLTEELSAVTVDIVHKAKLETESSDLFSRQTLIKEDIKNIDKVLSARKQSESQGNLWAGQYRELQRQKEKNEDFIKNPSKLCPTCNTTLENCDTSHAQTELGRIELSMTGLMTQLEALSAELDKPAPSKESLTKERDEVAMARLRIDTELASIRATEDRLKVGRGKAETLELSIENKLEVIAEYQREYLALSKAEIFVDASKLEELKAKLETNATERINLIRLIEESNVYTKRLDALRDGFKEIKSYVFNSMLNEINARVHQYLSHLFELPVTVRFRNDAMKIETDVTFDGVERGLGLLSGGQFRRVSLAVDLALADVITARRGANLGVLILDEYFKDLSEASMEKCLTLLEGRGQPVLLIEHNSIFKNIVNNSFFVKLQGGISRAET